MTSDPTTPPGPGQSPPASTGPTPYPSLYSGKELTLSGLPGTGNCGGPIDWVDISRPSVTTDQHDSPGITFQGPCDGTHLVLDTHDYADDHMAASLQGGNTAATCEEGIQERPIATFEKMKKGETVCAETDEVVAAITWTGGGTSSAKLTITAWQRPSS